MRYSQLEQRGQVEDGERAAIAGEPQVLEAPPPRDPLDVVSHPGFVLAERPRVPRGEHGVEPRMGARLGLECPQPALEIGDG